MTLRRFSTSNITTGSKSSKLWDGETFPGYFESIQTVILSSAQSSITFSDIPQNYTHLQIRTAARSAGTASDYHHLQIQFNNDTGNNYWGHGLYGTGSAVAAHNDGALGSRLLSVNIPTTTQTASTFNGGVIDILDYRNTNKNKVVRALGGFDSNGAGALGLYSGNWNSTNAITSIQLRVYQGSNFSQNTHFALYGIRSA